MSFVGFFGLPLSKVLCYSNSSLTERKKSRMPFTAGSATLKASSGASPVS